MKLTLMIGKHLLVTLVEAAPQNQRNAQNVGPLQDLDPGGNPPRQLVSLPDVPHVVPKAQETTHLASKISSTNPKGQTIKDVVWKAFTQTNSKVISPKPNDS